MSNDPQHPDGGAVSVEAIVDAVATGIVVQRPDGVIVSCNRAAERILGLTADQMSGRTSMDPRWAAIHEDGSPFPGETHPAMVTLATGRPCRDVVMGVHKPDGTLTWISVDAEPVARIGAPRPDAVVTTFLDITARRQVEDDLRRSHARFERLVERLPFGVYTTYTHESGDAWFDYASRRAGEILDMDPADVIADPANILGRIHPDDLAGFIAANRAAHAAGTPFLAEARIQVRGEWRIIRVASQPDIDQGAAEQRWRGFVMDVTDERVAQRRMEESRRELAEAQRMARTGSWRWDSADAVATWSDEIYRIYGVEVGGPVPPLTGLQRFFAPASYERLVAAFAATVADGVPYELDLELVRPDGTRRAVIARGEAVCDAAGAVTGVRGTVSDVTEQAEARARLESAQRSEAVGRLAGGLAHEFNNLLAAINGFAGFLASETPADDPRMDDIAGIQEAGRKAAQITRQLLAFGRRQVLRPVVVDVTEVVVNVLPMLRGVVAEGVDVLLNADGSLLPVRTDRAQLEQVIVNLVVNARDLMPEGGRVAIDLATEEVAAGDRRLGDHGAPGTYVRVAVRDTGPGLEADVLAHVFEPFFSPIGRRRPGTGLNLSSVEGAIAQSGGFVSATSSPGEGSTFSVFLPRAEGVPVHSPTTDMAPAITMRPAVILLVEDQPAVRVVTARTLRAMGHTVLEADGPLGAVELAEMGTPFELALTDVVMPAMSGRELADRLRELRPGLRVLFMSGYPRDMVFGGGMLPSGTPFLAKPFTADDLAATVRRALAPSQTGAVAGE